MPEFRYYLRGDGECNTIKCADCARYNDTTPIDAEWLESLPNYEESRISITSVLGITVLCFPSGMVKWNVDDGWDTEFGLPDNPTRGQLLHLLAALTKGE